MTRFEHATSASQTRRSDQAELHPVKNGTRGGTRTRIPVDVGFYPLIKKDLYHSGHSSI